MIDNTQGLSGPYQGIYAAGIARINQNTAAAKGRALRGAANQGVMTSGVSQIPQQGLDKEGMQEGADLAANVVGKQYQDTIDLQNKKDLLSYEDTLSQAADARKYEMQKKLAGQNLLGSLAGGGLAGLGSILSK